MKSSIIKFHEQVISGNAKLAKLVSDCQDKYQENIACNSLITETFNEGILQAKNLENEVDNNSANLLFGVPYTLKDLICTKEIKTTGGSRFLKNFIPSFDSTIQQKLKSQKAILVGKSNLDEFGLGGTGLNSFAGETKNIFDVERISGGSSSGSVNNVACGEALFSIGTDTGDSVRRPASFLGVVGYKPSYGLISRFGVFPYAPSLDTVGIIANSVADCAIVADAVVGYDEKDFSSQKSETNFFSSLKNLDNQKFAVLERMEDHLGINEKKLYLTALEKIQSRGHTITVVKIESQILNALISTYRIISFSEAISCYANMTGIPFGESSEPKEFEKLILENRTANFNWEVKRRFSIGTLMMNEKAFSKNLIQAKKIRQLITSKTNNIFDEHILLLPSASSVAPLISDIKENKQRSTIADTVLLIANFGGFPSITIPAGKVNGLPFGINLNLGINRDKELLSAAMTVESILEEEIQNE